MMRLQQVTSAPAPTIPQTQPVPASKPSFKGSDDDVRDMWTKNKQDFEDLSNNPEHPTFLKNIGKAGVVIATGVLGYGTAKFGMRKCMDLISGIIKSKPVQAASVKAGKFVTEAVIPDAKTAINSVKTSKTLSKIGKFFTETLVADAKKILNAVKNFSISKKIAAKFDSVMTAVNSSKTATFIKEKMASLKINVSFASKRKIVEAKQFMESTFSSAKTKGSDLVKSTVAKIPTAEQAKTGAVETLAVGSGMAAAMTSSEVAHIEETEV